MFACARQVQQHAQRRGSVERRRSQRQGVAHARDLRRDDGAVAGRADADDLVGMAAHRDALLDLAGPLPAVGRAVATGVVELLHDGVLRGGQPRRRAPGDAAVAAPDDAGEAGRRRPGDAELRTLDVREVPVGRIDGREVGVAGEERRPGGGGVGGDGPGVAAPAAREAGLPDQVGVGAAQLAGEVAEGDAGRDHRGPAGRVAGVERDQRLRAHLLDQPGALDLRLPGRRQHEGQQLPEEGRVPRLPGLGLVVEDARLQRARAALHRRVHARDVGQHPLPQVGRRRFPGRAGGAVQTHAAHQPVGGQRRRPGDLGHASLRHAPVELHLPVAILGVHEAQPEQRVRLAPRVDVGHGRRVADDLDRAAQAGQAQRAVDLRRRGRAQQLPSHRADEGPALRQAQAQAARAVARIRDGWGRESGHCPAGYSGAVHGGAPSGPYAGIRRRDAGTGRADDGSGT